ncbi:hypothetical protein MMC34_002017 [Xylographa carneopallida]|nr:hypothetical protein [Xylographa carneopallida]
MFQVFSREFAQKFLTVLLLLYISVGNVESTSVFVLDDSSIPLTFALNIAPDSNDFYFHLSGPATNSWIAIGTGTEMEGSQMFLVYTSTSGNNITFSPRLASSHKEPSYSSAIKVSLLEGSGLINGSYVVNAHCQNCSASLNLESTSEPWIYAKGPSNSFRGDSPSDSIQRHVEYGRFTMNMVQAYGAAAIPTNVSTNSGAAEVGPPSSDNDYTAIAHAVFTCIAFVIVMPLGVVFLRILERVRWHWLNQLLALSMALIGLVIGIYLSTTYNKSKSFNSAHQIIGILVILALFLQAWLGWHHHQVYKRTKRTTPYAPVHRYFGSFLILAGLANGAIGLAFAENNNNIVVYLVISIILVVLVAVWVVFNSWWISRGRRNGIHDTIRGQYPSQRLGSDVNLELVRGQ